MIQSVKSRTRCSVLVLDMLWLSLELLCGKILIYGIYMEYMGLWRIVYG